MAARAGIAALALVAVLVGCTTTPPAQGRPLRTSPPPAAPTVDPIQEFAESRLGLMSLEEKVASLLMLHAGGTDASAMRAFAKATGAGGLILMGDNVVALEQMGALTDGLSPDPDLPLLIGIDQEGGTVRRLPDSWASAGQLRSLEPVAAREAFASRGAMLAAAGVSVNFGIVADVTGDTRSFIFDRVMGITGAEAAARVAEAVAGERGVVMSTLKHFPGHGVAPGDSHSSIPATGMGYFQWREEHAPPFMAGIDAGAGFVMFGHLRFDAIDSAPASLSETWHTILRYDLGFRGVSITDDMLMLQRSGEPAYRDPAENAIRAIAAGNTMLLYVGTIDVAAVVASVSAAVRSGRIPLHVIDNAARKLILLRRGLLPVAGL